LRSAQRQEIRQRDAASAQGGRVMTVAKPAERAHVARKRRIVLQSLPEAIRQAEKGDIKLLCDFFRDWMPEEEGALLADFIDRRLAPKPLGHPAGHVDTSAAAEMERTIVAIVNRRRRQWRASHDNKPLTRGLLDQWIDDVSDRYGEEGELHGLTISRDNIRNALERGKKRTSVSASKDSEIASKA
jgi:hypothetical protein